MIRLALILSLFIGPAAFADDAAPGEAAVREPLSEARRALIERAQAPTTLARLPVLGVDPLRTVVRASLKANAAALPNAVTNRFSTRTDPSAGTRHMREAADRAADRAMDGDGRGARGGHGGQGGHGEPHGDRHHDGPDGRGDPPPGGPPPSGGGSPPPHPP